MNMTTRSEFSGPESIDVIQALPIAVVTVSSDWRIFSANPMAETLFNTGAPMLIGQKLNDLIALPEELPQRLTEVESATARLTDVMSVDGLIGPLDVSIAEQAKNGRLICAMVPPALTSDKGSGVNAAAAAAAMLAHEIKNPLSGIKGAAQLIARDLDEGGRALTSLIEEEVTRITKLIERMELFGDDRPLELVPGTIYETIDHALRVAQAGFASAIAIREDFDPSLPEAMIHRDSLTQILVNLLKNASEATIGGSAPSIIVSTHYRSGLSRISADGHKLSLPIEIIISDNGEGVPLWMRETLFDAFVTGKAQGAGLGLAVVKTLAERMHGRIDYERDEHGGWTHFRLSLPRAKGSAA